MLCLNLVSTQSAFLPLNIETHGTSAERDYCKVSCYDCAHIQIFTHKLAYPLHTHTDPVNRSSLEVIETAQFVVCLDKAHSMTDTQVNKFQFHDFHKTVLANRFLHGNGSQHNSINRWFDAAIQVNSGD